MTPQLVIFDTLAIPAMRILKVEPNGLANSVVTYLDPAGAIVTYNAKGTVDVVAGKINAAINP